MSHIDSSYNQDALSYSKKSCFVLYVRINYFKVSNPINFENNNYKKNLCTVCRPPQKNVNLFIKAAPEFHLTEIISAALDNLLSMIVDYNTYEVYQSFLKRECDET